MSRIRDIANLFSGSTDAATDAEVASAISAHNVSGNGHVGRGNTASRPASPTLGDTYFDTTLDKLITYSSTGWSAVAPVPSAPTIGAATATGFTTATVAFTYSGSVPATSYTGTSSPGGVTATGSSSPLSFTGLSSGTTYTFTVAATGSNGLGSSSSS